MKLKVFVFLLHTIVNICSMYWCKTTVSVKQTGGKLITWYQYRYRTGDNAFFD